MFHDIKRIEKIDTRVNFIIKCDDEDQLNELKALLNTSKKMLTYDEFTHQFSQDNLFEHHSTYAQCDAIKS